jgi:triosephosphate isomerase
MRRPIVAGNWKMNGTQSEAATLIDGILAGLDTVENTEVIVCPPFTLISFVAEALNNSDVGYGAQNLNVNDAGAYTGEVSGPMLRDLGCTYVIVGHSERRAVYGESDDIVAEKFRAAQQHDLVPILCVGESLQQRENNQTEKVITEQLDAVIDLVGIEGFSQAVVAYEPIWAIGTGMTATPEQAQDVHRFIRDKLSGLDGTIAANLRLQYGGSVKGANAQGLFDQPDIDGGLIGGASLDADEFLNICRAG